MSYFTTRSGRIVAGTLAGALALSVTPIVGFFGTAGAADALPPVATPTGAGNFCENASATEPFTDVSDADGAQAVIACLVDAGITTGTTATTYSPNGSVTRRQMVLFLKRLADMANAEDTGTNIAPLPADDGVEDFGDTSGESAAVKTAIDQLVNADVVNGLTATTFGPGENVSRRQMAAFVNRLQEFLTGTALPATGDYFDDDNGDSGEDNLNAMAEAGIFQGDGAGNVFPGSDLTRRQMAN
ncbi:MAG: S-layer homology domain-containing protein, partial [Acidimicrobiales bacterium]